MATNDTHEGRSCGTDEVHLRLLLTEPGYVEARAAIENHAWRAERSRMVGRTGCTRIPVVVHVVYKTNAQNISDAQINSQIDVLNEDYRKQNGDLGSIPAVFQSLTADARIEFALATTDPNGDPTDGIVRVKTTEDSFGSDDAVKSSATGGSDAWPADKYLNIWVCNLVPWLGYAQFPGGPAATDGVVIRHSSFGTSGTAAAPFDLGRTATHEIGHWLNLRHIWGDDQGACNQSDFVADTPNQGGPNYGKPAFPTVSCNNGPNGDLFMNYMDYVDDDTMVMLTAGQVTRMQSTLDSTRSMIGTSVSCGGIAPTLKFLDDEEPIPTLKVHDDQIVPTLKFRDDQVLPTLKFRDDLHTLKVADDPGTTKFTDDPGTSPVIDPVKTPGYDKLPGSDQIVTPGDYVTPVPFILATPHHSMAWTSTYPAAAAQQQGVYEARVQQYEQLLAQYAEADAQGQLSEEDVETANRLYAEYEAMRRELQQFTGT